MNLAALVSYFRKGGSYEDFCQAQALDAASEVVEFYMEKPLHVENELAFFEIEQTQGRIEYFFNGISYVNLFDFFYFLDAIEEVTAIGGRSVTDEEIAETLYAHAINDE